MPVARTSKSAIIPPPAERAADEKAFVRQINRHVAEATARIRALKLDIAKIEDPELRDATLRTNPLRR